MSLVDVSGMGVLLAAVAGTGIGALWYSPLLFGKQWATLMGWTDPMKQAEMKKGATRAMMIGFVTALIMAYVLAQFVELTGALTMSDGMQVGFWVWLGFVATVMYGMVLWEGKPFKLYALNVGYYLVSLPIMGAILVAL